MVDQKYDTEVEIDETVDQDLELDEAAKRSADKTGGETTAVKQGSSDTKAPSTKMGMINAMMSKMGEMKKAELESVYEKMLKAMDGEDNDDDDDDDDDMEEMKSKKKMVKSSYKGKKMTKEDLDISADIEAIFSSDESLSEEFKNTASELFQAAVVAQVNEHITTVSEDIDNAVEEQLESIKEEISGKLNEYLEYVVEQFMEQNELAIERGMRAEIAEEFLQGLKSLFVEHYVDVPEEKVDVVEDLANKVDELEESLDEAVNYSISIQKELSEMKRTAVIDELSEELADTQVEKLKSLAEGIEYEDDDQFREKVAMVKENYFPTEATVSDDEQIDESTDGIDTNGMSDTMARYMTHLSQLKTKK